MEFEFSADELRLVYNVLLFALENDLCSNEEAEIIDRFREILDSIAQTMEETTITVTPQTSSPA